MPYDLFISYAHQGDNTSREAVTALVARLHAELESDFRHRFNRDLEIFFDKEDIKDFDHWQVRCHRALRDSRFFIACLSRTYLLSDACRWEWEEWCKHEQEHGLWGQGAASLWFVKLEDIDAPEDAALLLRWKGDLLQRFHIQCHEWRYDNNNNFLDTAARSELQQLTEHVAQRLRLLTLDRTRRGNLPWPNANFVGREPELASLHAALLDAPEQSPAGIHGIGGMGKTALAQAFAYKEADAFPGGCWLLRCEGRDRLLTVFRSLVNDLEIELTDEEKLDDAKTVQRVFDVLRVRGPVLFLLDNVDRPALLAQEQIKLLADQPWARVLFTTRLAPDDFTKGGAKVRPLDLDRLPENQAVDLIRRYQLGQAFASPEHEAAAREIVRELSGLTLSVETAAVYLGQCDPRVAEPQYAVDVRDYLNKLREDLKTGGSEGVMSQLREVTATLRPTLARLDAPARTVLQIASLLAPDGVALPWVRTIAGQSHPELATDAATGESDQWTQLIRGLIGMRLFQSTAEPRVVAIHRFLQRVLETELLEGRKQVESRLVEHIANRGHFHIEGWIQPESRWEISSLNLCASHWLNEPNDNGILLSSAVAIPLVALASFSEAELLLRIAVSKAKEIHGENHDHYGTALSNLAVVLSKTNHLNEAESVARQALLALERAHGVESLPVACALNTLGVILSTIHCTEEAELCYRRGLSIFASERGLPDATVAMMMSNLADLLAMTNQVTEAEALWQQSLIIFDSCYGSEHPEIARVVNNMCAPLNRTRQNLQFEPLIRYALSIQEKCFGLDHIGIAPSLLNLMLVLTEKGHFNEAEAVARRCLRILESNLGLEHNKVADNLVGLAGILRRTNRKEEAKVCYKRAVQIYETSLGQNHPKVSTSLNNLAGLLRAMQRLQEAEEIYRRVLQIDETCYAQYDPESAIHLCNLASLFEQMNRLEEAQNLRRKAVILFFQFAYFSGHEHPGQRKALLDYLNLLTLLGFSSTDIKIDIDKMHQESVSKNSNGLNEKNGHKHQ
jgi:tetratricopeptide (TPR) repeat protein